LKQPVSLFPDYSDIKHPGLQRPGRAARYFLAARSLLTLAEADWASFKEAPAANQCWLQADGKTRRLTTAIANYCRQPKLAWR
jgi:hypothetical protein